VESPAAGRTLGAGSDMALRNPTRMLPIMRGIARYIYLGAGLLSVGLAIVGTVLPVIPTVPLVLLAGYFFSRSSERFDKWLVEHAVFGPIIRDWRAGLGFTIRAKVMAVLAISASFSVTLIVVIDSTIGRVAMITLAVGVVAYIVSRPTKPLAGEAG
jgi:uncharacterized membrane protein YbaN (DUF454 family)